ncbi:MAG: FHA domain-containing protein, partial [Kangiellaceae bacterium]|nr:FHA domain-containing protein [Kangiellaceae bacterium]
MSIVVSILEYPEGVELAQSSMTFDEQGGTLGRSPDNTWILADPERFLSGVHSEIVFENGSYYLVDTSTNGTYLNNSGEPLGKGN